VGVAVTIQPTTPFTKGADIDMCVRKLLETGADSVITVAPIRERPEWMVQLGQGERLAWTTGIVPEGAANVSQNLPELFIPNGGVYATRRSVVIERGEIFGSDTRAVIMTLEASVDIDEPIDFLVAEAVLTAGRNCPA
jgi:CMP-N-acetylneuraminic acid synthetase